LWVRETHGFFCPGDPKTGLPDRSDIRIIYPATDEVPDIGVDEDDWFIDERPLPMRPSIHMPKWACRLWLRVTDTDVEQIQDMTEQGAEAEGFTSIAEHSPGRPDKMIRTARQSFRDHWETRYPGSWERNDWVWVYEFERCERPAGWPESEVAA
jgi:hypothetical protein